MLHELKVVAAVVFAVALAAFGILCVVWPERVKGRALRGIGGRLPLLQKYLATGQYLRDVRVAGALIALVALFGLYVYFFHRAD